MQQYRSFQCIYVLTSSLQFQNVQGPASWVAFYVPITSDSLDISRFISKLTGYKPVFLLLIEGQQLDGGRGVLQLLVAGFEFPCGLPPLNRKQWGLGMQNKILNRQKILLETQIFLQTSQNLFNGIMCGWRPYTQLPFLTGLSPKCRMLHYPTLLRTRMLLA